MEKRKSLQSMILGKLVSFIQINKMEYCLTPYIKLTTRQIKYLKVRLQTIKLLYISITLFDISLSFSYF